MVTNGKCPVCESEVTFLPELDGRKCYECSRCGTYYKISRMKDLVDYDSDKREPVNPNKKIPYSSFAKNWTKLIIPILKLIIEWAYINGYIDYI